MKIGVSIPNNWGVGDPQEVITVAVLAESLGYDSLWTAEHLLNVGYLQERIGEKPYYHPLAVLSYVAAKTARIKLGTSVVVLPFHHPVELAKYAATLDQLSGGRLILGVGVGGLVDEFDALGIPWNQRGAISDESMRIIKELWTKELASHHGKRWNFANVRFTPKPAQKPHIPLWVGGASAAAKRRAALLGDGWQPTGINTDEFRAGRDEIRQQVMLAGREPTNIVMSMRVNVSLKGTHLTTEIENRSVLPGADLEALAAGVEAWRDAGCDHLVLAVNTDNIRMLRQTLERIAVRILR